MASYQQQQQQLTQLHHKAISQLHHKLSRIPERVFPLGRKPTIMEIYTSNAEAIYIAGIPEHLQLPFIFEHYQLFVAADFKARKKEGDMNINLAIWYWQMDDAHSFSRKHKQVRYNVLMACIIRADSVLGRKVASPALEFCGALIDAWVWSVTRQDEYVKQAEFLEMWQNGPYDLMYFGRKAKDAMDAAIRGLEQYVPSLKPFVNEDVSFWEGLRYTPPKKLKTYGPLWAIQYIVDAERMGHQIEVLGKNAEAETALASETFIVSLIHHLIVLHCDFGLFRASDTLLKHSSPVYSPCVCHGKIR
jgi:hypothetical protein